MSCFGKAKRQGRKEMTQEKKKAIENLLFLSLSVVSGSQGAFLSVDKDRNLLRFEAVAVCAGLLPIIDTISERLVGKSVPIGEGVTGRAAATREVQFATSADGSIFSRVDGDGKPNAVLAVPVLKGEELVGVMTAVCFDREHELSGTAKDTYVAAAQIAAELL